MRESLSSRKLLPDLASICRHSLGLKRVAIKWRTNSSKNIHIKLQPAMQSGIQLKPARKMFSLALVALFFCCLPLAYSQEKNAEPVAPAIAETVVLPLSVPDPLEPLNRAVWAFNKGVMKDVIKPTSRVYRFIIAKPVRRGIGNFAKNLTYPGRLLNNLLQGKWHGARDESYRFFCNSTVGAAGFFNVADKWRIPKSDADFGQTFGKWGWQPNCYLMLPLFGPSNERDLLGLAADTAANPLLYIAPYEFQASNPFTYLGPYSYFSYAATYNDLSDTVGEFVRFSQASMDPYSEIQYAWTFARANRVADFQVKGVRDEASIETIESVFFTYKDPEFPVHGKTRSVLIPATGRKLPFTYWLQPGKAPMVYIVPGLGAHRMAQPSLALAELAYKIGFSVVCLSSTYNSEFMEQAATAAMPAYLPVDGQDLLGALTQIDQRLRVLYPQRCGEKALLGYSMGALQTLFLAADEKTNQTPAIKFDRYIAISPPVRMLYGVTKLDEFYDAPLAWPVEERTDNIENTFLKVADLSKNTLTPQTSLPFNAIESKFLIGLTFRRILRDTIFSSQRRNNQGVLKQPIWNLRREPVYQEILQYSFRDYFAKFAVPYYQSLGTSSAAAELEKAGDLRTYEAGLKHNPNIRVIINKNDFLLAPEDRKWLGATFPPEQLTVFPQGGHMGNLFEPEVQKTILNAFSGLKPYAVDSKLHQP